MDASDPRFGTMLDGSLKVNNETYKLIETLQYHTLLIGLNVMIWKYGCCGCENGSGYKYGAVKSEDSEFESEVVPIKQ